MTVPEDVWLEALFGALALVIAWRGGNVRFGGFHSGIPISINKEFPIRRAMLAIVGLLLVLAALLEVAGFGERSGVLAAKRLLGGDAAEDFILIFIGLVALISVFQLR